MKRFYTGVETRGAAGGWIGALEGRPVHTPGGTLLVAPNAAVATAIAAEWVRQGDVLRPATMPLTGLVYAAIDRVAPDVAAFAATLAAFAETELLCYRAEGPAMLTAAQADAWDPLLAWARTRYDIDFVVTSGIIHAPQPPAALARIAAVFRSLDAVRLAALHPVVTICGSAIIGLAVGAGHLNAEQAFAAGQLDELWQAAQWGTDPLAAASLASRRAALDDAVRLLDLLNEEG